MAKRRNSGGDDMYDTDGKSDMPFGGKGRMGGHKGRKKSRKGKRSKGRY